MSAPFGGHPTLAQYMAWIRECGGHCQCGYGTDKRGRAVSLVKIVADNGKAVVVPGIDQAERMVPTYIAYLDRRLGVNSPWFKLPE